MAGEIDREGAWLGRFVESGVGTQQKSGMPRFVGRLMADKKWVESKDEMEAFSLTEPGWVDWSSYEQDITAYLNLLTADKDTGEVKEIFLMDQLRKALGWDGASFGTLGTTDWSKKTVMFWTGWNEWEGKTTLRVDSVDEETASPNRSIRTIDASGLKDLDAKFANLLKGTKTAPATASKPATPPAAGKPPTGKPATPPPSTAAKGAGVTTASAPASTPPQKSAPSSPPKGPPKAPAPTAPVADGLTMEKAWEYVVAGKGEANDDAMAEKWIDACAAIAPGKDEATITPAEWKAVADKTLALLKG